MILENKKSIKLIILLSIVFFMTSCKTESITIKKEKLSISEVTLYEGNAEVYTAKFLRIDFHSSLPPFLIDKNSMFHVKANFIKKDKIVANTSASGIFLVLKSNQNNDKTGGSYSAYISRSLEVKLKNSKNILPVDKLDYDGLSLIVAEPVMMSGDKYRSNVLHYTKKDINSSIKKGTMSKITLKY